MLTVAQIAQIIAKDIKKNRLGEPVHALAKGVAADSVLVLEVLDLMLVEARKAKPKEALMAAHAFLLSRGLEEARWRQENQSVKADDLIEKARSVIVAAAEERELSFVALATLIECFAEAKIDVGEGVRHLMNATEPSGAEGMSPEAMLEQFSGALSHLAKELDNDAFQLHAQINDMLYAMSPKDKISMISILVTFDVAALREAVLGWLLDPDSRVANTVAGFLANAADSGHVSGVAANRLVLMRNWVPEDRRSAIDAIVRVARQRGVKLPNSPTLQVVDVLSTGCDGAGAQSHFVLMRQGHKHTLACLLFKHGFGIRDILIHYDISHDEADQLLTRVATELHIMESSLEAVKIALAHGLSVNSETNEPLPFGLVGFLESTGLGAVHPQRIDPDELIETLLAEVAAADKNPEALKRALTNSKKWDREHGWLDSWFEDSDDASHQLRTGPLTRKELARRLLSNVVEKRRKRWGELLAWTAHAVHGDPESEDWVQLALVARELLGDRPIASIPLAGIIANSTAGVLLNAG
jgi:hypothetical protein